MFPLSLEATRWHPESLPGTLARPKEIRTLSIVRLRARRILAGSAAIKSLTIQDLTVVRLHVVEVMISDKLTLPENITGGTH